MPGREREDELTSHQPNQHESEPRAERGAGSPPVPLMGEQQGSGERSHEELVSAFRNAIRQEQHELGDLAKYHSPVKIINSAFMKQVQYTFWEGKEYKQRGEFFAPILHAWEVIAYEHYGKGSVNSGDTDRHFAAKDLCTQYQRAKAMNKPHPETMTLSDPMQIKILDAAAEAVDIPHQKGQGEFVIPEKLRWYEEWLNETGQGSMGNSTWISLEDWLKEKGYGSS